MSTNWPSGNRTPRVTTLVAGGMLVVAILTAGCASGLRPGSGSSQADTRVVETYELETATPSATADTATGPPLNLTVVGLAGGLTTVVRPPDAPPIVVDAGSDRNATRLGQVLERRGVSEIGILVVTTTEGTDIGGATALVRRYDPQNIAHNGRTRNTTDYHRYLRTVVDRGLQHDFYHVTNETRFRWGSGEVDILAPAPSSSGDYTSESQIVFSYQIHGRRVLHLGNASPTEQASLLRRNRSALGATVLVADENRIITPELRRAVDPNVTVIGERTGTTGTGKSTSGPNRSVVLKRGETVDIRLHPNGTLTEPRVETSGGSTRQATT